jgi:hypothetical protein
VSVPAADKLRPSLVRYCRWSEEHMGYCGSVCTWHYELLVYEDVLNAADLLDNIDALHQPKEGFDEYLRPELWCPACANPWPCPTALLLHPEEIRRGNRK